MGTREKGLEDKQWYTQHYTASVELLCSGRVNSSCSTGASIYAINCMYVN